jgi:RNA polymerase sigma-70 factor, ECF subfamily
VSDVPQRVDIQTLVAQHHGVVYGYAFRLTGSVADAEDLTQQVFLTAHERLGQLQKPDCARSWLLTILRNRFLKDSHRPRPVPATTVGLDLDTVASQENEEETVDSAKLQQALAELSPDFRVVLLMFYFEDCSYRDIARQLEVPIGTVMSRLARAKRFLRGKLAAAPAAKRSQPTATR